MKMRFYAVLFALFAMVSCSKDDVSTNSFWGEYEGSVTTIGHSLENGTASEIHYENMPEQGFGSMPTTIVVKRMDNSTLTIQYESFFTKARQETALQTLPYLIDETGKLIVDSEGDQLTIEGGELIYNNKSIVPMNTFGGGNLLILLDTQISATKK